MVSLVILGNEKGESLGIGSDMGTQYLFAAVILMELSKSDVAYSSLAAL